MTSTLSQDAHISQTHDHDEHGDHRMFGLATFLVADAMTFAGFFAAYLTFKAVNPLPEGAVFELELPLPILNTVLLLAFTDLAFSIDSVAAAVAISDQILLISSGAFIGIVALRFTSALFIRWLDLYPRLETAGFLAVAFVAMRLIVHVLAPSLNQPDWLTLLVVLMLFAWGMSIRSSDLDQDESHAC